MVTSLRFVPVVASLGCVPVVALLGCVPVVSSLGCVPVVALLGSVPVVTPLECVPVVALLGFVPVVASLVFVPVVASLGCVPVVALLRFVPLVASLPCVPVADQITLNQIDHVLVTSKKKELIGDVRTMRGPIIDSDHYLLKITVNQKLPKIYYKKNRDFTGRWNESNLKNPIKLQEYRRALYTKLSKQKQQQGVERE